MSALVIANRGEDHAFGRHRVERHHLDARLLRLFHDRLVRRRVKKVDGDAVRMGGDHLLEDLVLLDDVGLLRRQVVDLDVDVGGLLQIGGRIVGAVMHQVEPRMDDLRHDHEPIVLRVCDRRSQAQGARRRQHRRKY
jgi:hypothetical protein